MLNGLKNFDLFQGRHRATLIMTSISVLNSKRGYPVRFQNNFFQAKVDENQVNEKQNGFTLLINDLVVDARCDIQ